MKLLEILTQDRSKLKVKTTKPINMIGCFARIIDTKYPKSETCNYRKLTELINKEFNTQFSIDDVIKYYQNSIDHQDLEIWYQTNYSISIDDNLKIV